LFSLPLHSCLYLVHDFYDLEIIRFRVSLDVRDPTVVRELKQNKYILIDRNRIGIQLLYSISFSVDRSIPVYSLFDEFVDDSDNVCDILISCRSASGIPHSILDRVN
jgi:hypothetical protein